MLCAALWPDPADENCPPSFRETATQLMQKFAFTAVNERGVADLCHLYTWGLLATLRQPEGQLDPTNPNHLSVLRTLLLQFIADFSNWDASTEPHYLETARALTQAAHESLGGLPGTRPLVVDPFAGGGAIPLEALRVGADAFASALNPVAVLLNKVVLEYIPKYGQRLADEVRKWGQWVKEQAENVGLDFLAIVEIIKNCCKGGGEDDHSHTDTLRRRRAWGVPRWCIRVPLQTEQVGR